MVVRSRITRVWQVAWTLLLAGNAAAADYYRPVYVGDLIALEIPAHWHVIGGDDRRNLAAAGKAMVESSGVEDVVQHASLAVNAVPSPPGAMIRGSYIPTDGPGEAVSQQDVVAELAADRAAALAVLDQAWAQMVADMAKPMAQSNMEILERGSADVEILSDGLYALTFPYRRTSAMGQGPWRVTQHHIPLGTQKVLMTLSFRESSEIMYQPILEHVKRSLRLRSQLP